MNTSTLPAVGDRVRITGVMPDDASPLPIGTTGTVREVRDSVGQIFVDWDIKRGLILLDDDPFEVVTPSACPVCSHVDCDENDHLFAPKEER